MNFKQSQIFYDGCNIAKYANHPMVKGFTMNSTFIKDSGCASWKIFYDLQAENIRGRPISLQVRSDENIAEEARILSAFGPNVFVKVPVINSKGESNLTIIRQLLDDGIKINVTCVFTQQQVDDIYNALFGTMTPYIISIFAGGISDTGIDPLPLVHYTVQKVKEDANAQVLWAGVKDNLAVMKAVEVGCHIITIPDTVMDRINRLGLDHHQMSIDKVKLFNTDASRILLV